MKVLKILVISDEESVSLWDYFDKSKLEGIDLIISCGDLAPQYLSFLATFFSGPVLYVHGNHDECYLHTPPEGCICIDDQLYEYQGLRILGLGGSMRYHSGEFQYTQNQMKLRVLKLWLKIKRRKGFDLLVTHSPAKGLGDGDDLPHTGVDVFNYFLDKCSPRFFIHGHMHLNYGRSNRLSQYKKTIIVNAFDKFVIECPVKKVSL